MRPKVCQIFVIIDNSWLKTIKLVIKKTVAELKKFYWIFDVLYEPIQYWCNKNTVGFLLHQLHFCVKKRKIYCCQTLHKSLRLQRDTVRVMVKNFSWVEHLRSEGKMFYWATSPCQREHVRDGKWLKFNCTKGLSSSILLAKEHINGAKSKLWCEQRG